MKAVHEELKEIRLKKNISLKNISEKTKIRIDFLEKLEDGDYSIAPMPYIRAFLREYAEIVGIDPGLVLLRLDNKIDSVSPPEIQPEAIIKPAAVQTAVQDTPPDVLPKRKRTPKNPEKKPVQKTGTVGKEKQPHTGETNPERALAVKKTVMGEIPETPKAAEQPSGTTEQPEKTAPVVLEEPRSYSTLIFAVFIIIITVVALIIFFINKG